MFTKEAIIPAEVNVEVNELTVKVSGPKGNLERRFETTQNIKIAKQENKIVVSSESERRDVKSLVGTVAAHIRNMIEGVTKGFVYKLKVVYSHFPVTVKLEGDKILIQNFLGERAPRVAKIVGNAKVEIKGQEITVTGINKDDVGQTAANLEQITRIKGYDRRTFMDGCYIVSKE